MAAGLASAGAWPFKYVSKTYDNKLVIGAEHLFNSRRFHLFDEVMFEDAIPIAEQISWRGVPWKRLPELLRSPLCSRVCGDSEVKGTPPLVRQNKEDIENLKPDRRHGKEVYGHKTLQVIVEKSPRPLGRRVPIPDEVLAQTRLADVDAELAQLAVDAWRSPTRIISAHAADEAANLAWDRRTPGLAHHGFSMSRRGAIRCGARQ